jgi:phosphate transport system permease protein
MNSNSLKISNENLKRRLNAERRFKFYGVIAISLALIFVLILFTNIISKGYSAFYRTLIEIKIEFNDKVQPEMFKQMSDTEINKLDLYSFSKKNIYSNFPDIEKKSDKKKIIKLFSIEFEEEIKTYINKNKNNLGNTINIFLPLMILIKYIKVTILEIFQKNEEEFQISSYLFMMNSWAKIK